METDAMSTWQFFINMFISYEKISLVWCKSMQTYSDNDGDMVYDIYDVGVLSDSTLV